MDSETGEEVGLLFCLGFGLFGIVWSCLEFSGWLKAAKKGECTQLSVPLGTD